MAGPRPRCVRKPLPPYTPAPLTPPAAQALLPQISLLRLPRSVLHLLYGALDRSWNLASHGLAHMEHVYMVATAMVAGGTQARASLSRVPVHHVVVSGEEHRAAAAIDPNMMGTMRWLCFQGCARSAAPHGG